MTDNQILKIAFFAQDRGQIYKIHNKLNPDQKKKYSKSPLWDLRFSISKKLSLIKVAVDETNLEMDKINKILKRKKEEVDVCLKRNKYIFFSEIHRIYRILAYVETTLIEMVSVTQLLIKFISYFYIHIFGERKGAKDVVKDLKNEGIDMKWNDELYFIRRGLVHHYSGWISFKKKNDIFELVFSLPKSVKSIRGYKKYHYDRLDTEKLNEIFGHFSQFIKDVNKYLIDKIKESS